jgi:hypothetical protein
VELKFADGTDTGDDDYVLSASADWLDIDIPLPHFSSKGYDLSTVTQISFIINGTETSPAGHFLVDNIRLVGFGGATAMVETKQVSTATTSLAVSHLSNRTLLVSVPQSSEVSILDLGGRRLAAFGENGEVKWQAPGAGTYLVRMVTRNAEQVSRVVVK